ncbi:hypothetical protein IFM89_035063 [Coptis chinensis]|uniref:Uncharacterized protein n=1 Tax=Coptis chinensis TaxID=261450 RepID=A0A835HAW2_9MAGN|nr:hypothetical protein IFM89_035063 [Coptis chinensis]
MSSLREDDRNKSVIGYPTTLISFIGGSFSDPIFEFQVDMVNIPLNASASVISPNWEFGFLVENPNKKADIYSDVMEVSLFYKGEFLCETDVSPFEQGKNTKSLLWAGFKDVEKKIVDLISEDSKRGMVSMNVEVMG